MGNIEEESEHPGNFFQKTYSREMSCWKQEWEMLHFAHTCSWQMCPFLVHLRPSLSEQFKLLSLLLRTLQYLNAFFNAQAKTPMSSNHTHSKFFYQKNSTLLRAQFSHEKISPKAALSLGQEYSLCQAAYTESFYFPALFPSWKDSSFPNTCFITGERCKYTELFLVRPNQDFHGSSLKQGNHTMTPSCIPC